MSHALRTTLTLAALAGWLAGCGEKDSGAAAPGSATADGATADAKKVHENKPKLKYSADAAGLKKLMTELRAACAKKDIPTAAAMTKAIIPNEASLKKALRDDATEVLAKMVKEYSKVPPNDEVWASVFGRRPERSEIQVHGATTEEIAAYAKGSVAFKEFPGGTRDAAKTVLRPKMSFYEVEFLEPGKDSGMKYHLFFHDGTAWKMLGKVWRAMR